MKISVTIIALNEETNIARCLNSVSFADEIIVVDSNSSDRTAEIAKANGAKVINQPFLGYGQQKNFAASHAANDWILNIDADEEVTKELKTAILNIDQSKSVFAVNRSTNYCGRWIKHGGWSPDWVNRLYNKNKAKWTEPNVHEDLLPNDSSEAIGRLGGNLKHYSFPTITSQINTNLKYARLGSKDLVAKKGRRPYLFELVTRPLFKFIECYILKSGFLDGKEGFIIAVNAGHSMFMKYSMAYLGKEKF